MDTEVMVTRLIEAWNQATTEDREAGEEWYKAARAAVANMAARHGVSKSCAAGVVAALSPRIHWSRNLEVTLCSVVEHLQECSKRHYAKPSRSSMVCVVSERCQVPRSERSIEHSWATELQR